MVSTAGDNPAEETEATTSYTRYVGGTWQQLPLNLPEEQTLSIQVNGKELVSILCTPEKLNCLVVGFLRSEGFIAGPRDIAMMRICPDDRVAEVRLTKELTVFPRKRTITSGCGGGATFDMAADIEPLQSLWRISPGQLLSSMKLLQSGPGSTGSNSRRRGMHASGLSDGNKLIVRAEDIGRHNTLDKIWGECMLAGISTSDRLLVTTGRVSSEMLLKTARMGIPVVASLNSPTRLATELASKLRITVVGYARGEQLSIYSHPQRIDGFPFDA